MVNHVKEKEYRRNIRLLNERSMYKMRIAAWEQVLGKGEASRTVVAAIEFGNAIPDKIMETINLIKKIFVSRGFNEDEAIKYLNENKHIVLLDKNQLLENLSILSIVSKDDEALFEKPSFLLNRYSKENLYDSVKNASNTNDTSLENINSIARNINRKIEFSMRPIGYKMLVDNYKNGLEKSYKKVL